jgi:hypothetical protein
MIMTVFNQYLDIKLASPVYFCNNGTYNEYPIERTDNNVMMKIGFRFGLDKLSGGILMYKVQRKRDTRSNYQSSTNTTSTETVEDTLKMMRLLMVWRIERSWKFRVRIVLVEHGDELILDEDKLAQLYIKFDNQLSRNYDSFQSTWLVCDNIILMTAYEVVQEEGIGLKITISKGAKKYAMKPIWIDPERQVLYLMVLYSMLIYIVSITLQSTIDITVKNQCSDIKLTSPVYFTKDTTHHTQFPQQVSPKNIMKATHLVAFYYIICKEKRMMNLMVYLMQMNMHQ